VILPAVQSLRLLVGREASSENAELGLSAPRVLKGEGLGRRGLVGREGLVGALRARGRAVMLTAVQSLRLLVGGKWGLF
jgi:hypothetical protein